MKQLKDWRRRKESSQFEEVIKERTTSPHVVRRDHLRYPRNGLNPWIKITPRQQLTQWGKIHHHLIAAIISSDFARKGEKPQEEAVFTLSERWLYVRGAIQMCGLSYQHRLSCVVVSVKERRSGEGKIRRRSMTSRRRRCCRNWHRNVRNLTVLWFMRDFSFYLKNRSSG